MKPTCDHDLIYIRILNQTCIILEISLAFKQVNILSRLIYIWNLNK